jgi:hypothetical protein
MTLPLRITGIVFLILAFALVALPCGAGECSACAHGCLVHSKTVAGLRASLARVGAAIASILLLTPPVLGADLRIGQEIAPLRI